LGKTKADPRLAAFVEPIAREKIEKGKDNPEATNKLNVELYSIHQSNAKMKKQFKKALR